MASPAVQAETKVLTTEATYTMGDGETPSFAEAQVLQRAKQIALEQAGTYVESYTKTHNYDLTTEEIQTLAGGVLAVEVLEKTRTQVGDGLRFDIKIKATVTTDKMEDLAQRIKGKNVAAEYTKLQAEYARLSREVEAWKQRAAQTPHGPERDAALDQIKEREKAFGAIQREESTFFQRLVSGEQLIASAEGMQAEVDQLLEFIKERGHVIEIDPIRAFPLKTSKVNVRLTVPIRLQTAPHLSAVLYDAARHLGGDEDEILIFSSGGFNGSLLIYHPGFATNAKVTLKDKLPRLRLLQNPSKMTAEAGALEAIPQNHWKFEGRTSKIERSKTLCNSLKITFDVEFLLPRERIKKLDRVRAWFDEIQNAPSNNCATVIGDD